MNIHTHNDILVIFVLAFEQHEFMFVQTCVS